MTINRSQRQSLDKVCIFLPFPVFSNGQLYVSLSRGKGFENVRALIIETAEQGRLVKGKNNKNRIIYKKCNLPRTFQLININNM